MSQRLSKINEMMKREISVVVQRDFEFKDALVTVSEVEVTQDLREAKVFVSVLGAHKQQALDKLNAGHSKVQSRIAKRITLRCTPVLTFREDNSVERGVDMVNLLDEVAKLPTAPREDGEE